MGFTYVNAGDLDLIAWFVRLSLFLSLSRNV